MISIRFSFFVFPFLVSVLSAQAPSSNMEKTQFEVASVKPEQLRQSELEHGITPWRAHYGNQRRARPD